jgi:perosamine synthetase
VPISKVVVSDEEIAAVVAVLRSGNLREGPECRAFETEFAAAVGAEHALAVNSGTAALQLAYQALLQPGDEVLVPTFTFFATASMVAAVGAIPVFCDIRPETLTVDVEDAARRITVRTRAIAPVHLFGNPVDVEAVQRLAQDHDLRIVWDAAQAHLTTFDGVDVGSYGDAVCYSFYPSKNMTTGEGGMICTPDAELAERIRLLRSQGQPRKYWHTTIGYNFRLTDIQAALGRGQLLHLPAWTERRRAHAAYLTRRLAHSDLLSLPREQERGRHSYHQFSVLAERTIDRERVLLGLREHGVEAAVHYPTPLHLQPAFSAEQSAAALPVAEDVARRIFSIPVHPHLDEADLDHVASSVLACVEEAAKEGAVLTTDS